MFPPQFMLTFCVLLLSVITGLNLYFSNAGKESLFKSALITSFASVVVGGILMFAFYDITFLMFVICGCLVMFLGAHIVYATTLILKEKRKSLKMDDEVMGAVSYVTDIVGVWKHLFEEEQK